MQEDWRQNLKDYHEFMQWDQDEEYDLVIDLMSQEEAKKRLQDDIEDIIAMNGYNELYETERMYMELLGMEEEL